MIAAYACPTCSRPAKPKARFCPACYTVFPSEEVSRRNAGHDRDENNTWKLPALFLAALAGGWFLQVDANDWNAEPGSVRAVSRDAKRQLLFWAEQTGIGQSPGGRAGVLNLGDWSMCPVGSCEVVIHFNEGQSAAYTIERSTRGGAAIVAEDDRGIDLLEDSDRARMVVTAPDGMTSSVSIARDRGDRWSIVDPAHGGTETPQTRTKEGA